MLASKAAQCFLASSNGTWIGFAITYWGFSPSKASPVLVLQDLFVIPNARRSGIARTLLRHLDEHARAGGATRIQLQTDNDNLAARNLYASMGFDQLPEKTVYMRFF